MNNQLLLALVLAMDGVILITFGTLFYQLLRQQGRILPRLDFVEQGATSGAVGEAEHVKAEAKGLGVGAQFPAFSFPDTVGRIRLVDNLQ